MMGTEYWCESLGLSGQGYKDTVASIQNDAREELELELSRLYDLIENLDRYIKELEAKLEIKEKPVIDTTLVYKMRRKK